MKLIILSLKILLLISLVSCGSYSKPKDIYNYSSTSFGSIKSYTAKPVYKGKKERAIYVSAFYLGDGKNSQNRNEFDDFKTFYAFDIHRAITDKNYTYYYGLGAAYGKYEFNKTLNNYIVKGLEKKFHSFYAKAGANYTISKKNIDYRLFGLELNYHNESGDYHNFIDTMPLGEFSSDNLILSLNNPKSILSYNISTELVFKLKDKMNFTLGVFSGKSWYLNKINGDYKTNYNYQFGGMMTSFSFKNVTLSLIGESGSFKKSSFRFRGSKFGITYRLPNIKSVKNTKLKN